MTVRATNGAGLQTMATSNGVTVDTTAPVATGLPNDGAGADLDYQTSTTTLAANWATVFADAQSTIAGYEWAIGTTSGGTNVQGYTSVGTATSGSNSSLSLTAGTTYYVTVRATNGAGLQSTATSDGVTVGGLIVTAFTPTLSGFVAQFSGELMLAGLNLYDGAGGTLGAADVTLKDGSGLTVAGSMVVAANGRAIEFVKTGGVLLPDTYAVTLKSGATGFRDLDGDPLDGNNNGTTGDDYTTSFTVASSTNRVVSIPDMARGAGQPVNIPNAASGLPVRLDDAAGVTSLAVDLVYDPALLSITAATLAAGVPGDWSVVSPPDTSTPGVAKIRASGTTALSGTNVDVVRLTAAVPSTAPYGAVQAIRLQNVALNSGAIAAVGDVAVHKAVYLGDADSSGVHSGADAFLTVQAGLGLASGFQAQSWADPRIGADADASGQLSGADAFLIVQEGLGLSETFVPDNPHITVTPVGGGIDPQFIIDENIAASQGWLAEVPVKLFVEAGASNVGSATFYVNFDSTKLSINLSTGVKLGAATSAWTLPPAVLVSPGKLLVDIYAAGTPLADGAVHEVAKLYFSVNAGAALGTTPLDIEPKEAAAGGYTWTADDGSLVISEGGPLLINEILFNPPGSTDTSREYVELRGAPGASCRTGPIW